jgi:hypothetical protein
MFGTKCFLSFPKFDMFFYTITEISLLNLGISNISSIYVRFYSFFFFLSFFVSVVSPFSSSVTRLFTVTLP